jgi:hypothetical protein
MNLIQMTEIQQNTDKLISLIATKFEAGELDSDSLVQIFEVIGNYLNLKTVSDYAGLHRLTYNGVINTRKVKEIFGVKFVVDNN